MKKRFENGCCRCGFCCLSETCPIGQRLYNVSKDKGCPGLNFEEDIAVCGAIEWCKSKSYINWQELFGVDAGCCIKARAYKNGVEYDFALLSNDMKIKVVNGIRQGLVYDNIN